MISIWFMRYAPSLAPVQKGFLMRFSKRWIVLVVAALVSAAFLLPASAYADSPVIITPTKAENTAYNRCVKAAMAYAKKPQTITVNIKDLKLTKKQVVDVETRLHSNGDLWWINTFGLGLSTAKITMPCKYDDATITKMRAKFNKAVAAALKRIGPGMLASTKVHMIHDYIICNVKYEAHYKTAYDALVLKKGDCFGYTLGTDALLRHAGFQTDVAFNNNPDVDHCWNLVKIGYNWYHVDTTWDRYYTFTYYNGKTVHKWLLQPDKVMNQDTHTGWEAHHRCTANGYVEAAYQNAYFSKHCSDYKSIVRSFTKGDFRYTVTGVKMVSVAGVKAASQSKTKLALPATVRCKNVTYSVVGIGAKAFAGSRARTLYVKTEKLSKARVKASLQRSRVAYVRVPSSKTALYRTCFAKANCGKKVSLAGVSAKVLKAA